jgi:hypothetical protein
MYSVGTAYLSVVPSFRNIEREFRQVSERLGREVDAAIARAIPEGVREGAARASETAAREGARSGQAYAGAWRNAMDRHLRGMMSRLGDDARDEIKDIAKDLGELRDAVINVDVDSDFAMLEFRRIRDRIRELQREDHTIEMHFNLAEVMREAEQIERALRDSRSEMERAHEQALSDDQRRDADRARRQRELNENMQRFLRDQNRMEDEAYRENARRDNDRARRQRELNEGARRFLIEQQRMLREAYDENERRDRDMRRRLGGAYGEQAQRRTTAARDAIPDFMARDVQSRLRMTGVQVELAQIRAQFDRLSNLTVDVDIPAAQYQAELAALIARLEAVEANEVDIDIQAHTRAALAEVRALTGHMRRAGDDAGDAWGGSFVRNIRESVRRVAATISDIEIDADTTPFQLALGEVRARLLTLGNVRIGVDMDLAQFLVEVEAIERELADLELDGDVDIHTRLEAAATRAGLVQLHNQINQIDRDDITVNVDTDRAVFSLRNFADNVGISMSRLGLLISLGASLGTAIVPAAAAAAASISAIATAASAAVLGIGVFALGIFGTFKAIGALNQYQKDADKSAQNLSASQSRVAGAMDQVAGAAAGVRSAERNLIRAQKDAVDSVRDLVRAREEARRQLEDMKLAVKDNALALRQARLDEAEAKKDLDAVLANPRASEADREQARITYEQRVLQIEELSLRQDRLSKDEEVARKKGIEGSDQVQAAQERIASAIEAVADAQGSVASSHRSLEAANRALQQSYEKTGVAGGDALRNMREAMDALSPAGQRFALFIFSLKDEFKGLQAAAEEGLLPGLQQAITNMLPYLAPLQNLIGRVAQALGRGFVMATEQLKDPVWQRFFGYLSATAVPVLEGMFTFMMNVGKGIAGILLGLSGFNGPIGQGVLQWSEDFAAWGSTLDSNQGWQKFLQYVRDSWPEVRDFFAGLWDFTKKFVAAAAPIGEWVVGAFAKVFEWMNKLDTDTWTIIIGSIAGVGAALLVVAGITSVITTGWAGLIVALIGLIAAEWTFLYQKIEPVRVIMQALWAATVTGFTWMWQSVLKPGFSALMTAIRFLGDVAMWLWEHIFRNVFQWIQAGFSILWAAFQVGVGLFQIALKWWGNMFSWWNQTYLQPFIRLLTPFFRWIADIWEKDVLPNTKRGLRFLSDAFDTLKESLKIPIKFIVNTILNDGLLKGYNAIAKFFGVKPDDVKIDLPKGFHSGGAVRGKGSATSDSIVARLSDGEHVLTALEVAKLGGQDQVYRLRSMIRHGVLPGFAAGGAVSKSGDESWFEKLKRRAGDIVGGITNFLSDPSGSLKALLDKLLALVPGKESGAAQVAVGVPKKVLGLALEKVKDVLTFGSGDTGPTGPGPGFLPWPSSPGAQRGNTGVWKNILALIRSTGPASGSFGNAYRPGDPLWHGSGRAVDWMGYNQDALAQFFMNMQGRVLELIHTTDRGGYYISRGRRRSSMGRQDALHRNHIHIAMDQGGWLDPGYSGIVNQTGLPEAVLTNRQWRDISALARGGDGASAPTYQFAFRDTTLDPGRLRAIQDREAARERQGRAR